MGSNMRYIQFRDIHDRDISGVHCISKVLVQKLDISYTCFQNSVISVASVISCKNIILQILIWRKLS